MDERPEDRRVALGGEDAIAKVRELLPKFRSAMMITQPQTGELHVRPLALQGELASFGGVLWFFADARSRKVQESAEGAPVSLTCQSDEHSAYLHLVGSATLVRDLSKMRELYTPAIRAWFPEGLDDPHLALIKFEATSGAYWDSPGGILRALGSLAKSVVTGTHAGSAETGELRL